LHEHGQGRDEERGEYQGDGEAEEEDVEEARVEFPDPDRLQRLPQYQVEVEDH
jgi:hypothetical protein